VVDKEKLRSSGRDQQDSSQPSTWPGAHGANYDALCKERILPLLRSSLSNRLIYEFLGNRGYEYIFNRITKSADLRDVLRRQYRASLLKAALFPLAFSFANLFKRMKVEDKNCHHENCDCVWCTHMKESRASSQTGHIEAASAMAIK
jgi:hypothetical protein